MGATVEPIAASAIIVRREDDRVFLGKRSLDKASWPGLWETIGGGILAGETPVQCLMRELQEELRVSVRRFCFFRDYDFHRHVVRVFIVELADAPDPNPCDIIESGWFAKDDVRRLEFAMNCKNRLLDFFSAPEYMACLRSLK